MADTESKTVENQETAQLEGPVEVIAVLAETENKSNGINDTGDTYRPYRIGAFYDTGPVSIFTTLDPTPQISAEKPETVIVDPTPDTSAEKSETDIGDATPQTVAEQPETVVVGATLEIAPANPDPVAADGSSEAPTETPDPAKAASETPGPVVSDTVLEAVTPEPDNVGAEENGGDSEQQEPEVQEVEDSTPAVKVETAPADFRFPTTNQTRHCFTRYIEYHRCIAAKGEDAAECNKFAKYYRALCPGEWIERWNEQRENGTFPGPL